MTLLAKALSPVRATIAGFTSQKSGTADNTQPTANMSNNRQNVTWVEVG